MRILIAIPAPAARRLQRHQGRQQQSPSPTTRILAENTAADVGNTAQNIAADIGNDVKKTGDKIQNKLQYRRRREGRHATCKTRTDKH